MRKTALFTALLATLCLFAACSKDEEGVYNPKKKIANIYESSMSVYSWHDDINNRWIADTSAEDKTLAEAWTWDGKKLSKITFYEHSNVLEKADPVVSDVVTFTYDGKKVTRAEGNYEYMTFTYDSKELKSVEIYDKEEANALIAKFDFEHKDGKIVKINVTIEGDIDMDKSSTVNLEKVLFRNILPNVDNAEKTVAKINAVVSKSGAKAQMTVPFVLTWDGDNVSEMAATITMYGISQTAKITYTYDDKNNPYQNYLFGMINMLDNGDMATLNKNNVTKSVTTVSYLGQTDTEEMNYTYTYDGKWPTSRTMTDTYDDYDVRSVYTTTTYFEYK